MIHLLLRSFSTRVLNYDLGFSFFSLYCCEVEIDADMNSHVHWWLLVPFRSGIVDHPLCSWRCALVQVFGMCLVAFIWLCQVWQWMFIETMCLNAEQCRWWRPGMAHSSRTRRSNSRMQIPCKHWDQNSNLFVMQTTTGHQVVTRDADSWYQIIIHVRHNNCVCRGLQRHNMWWGTATVVRKTVFTQVSCSGFTPAESCCCGSLLQGYVAIVQFVLLRS